MSRVIYALSDSLEPYHSFWIRIGQYLNELEHKCIFTCDSRVVSSARKGDIVFIYRYSSSWNNIAFEVKIARDRGVKIISDVDDYLWFDGQNRGWNQMRIRGYTQYLKECTLITTSTGKLRDQIRVMFRQPKCIIVPNTAPKYRKIFKNDNSNKDKIKVGWTGAPWTRPADLLILKEPLRRLIHDRPEINLCHIGHLPGMPSFADIIGVNPSQVSTFPLGAHKDYIENLNLDIGLAPLESNCFNYYKSGIKAIEYSDNSIPWIASHSQPYIDLCDSWNYNGRLCSNTEDWLRNIYSLLDYQTRKNEAKDIQNLCNKYSSFAHGVRSWRKILNS